jgi:CheY-like chemotaxis protein
LQVSRQHECMLWVVRDNGQGIPPGELDAIFEPFHQGPAAVGTGTGLGLTISRDLARLLGGTLSASSVLGEGSVFTLEVPLLALPPVVEPAPPARMLAPSSTASPARTRSPPPQPSRISRTVLVIEDDQAHCAAVVAALQAPGVDIRTVANGAAALAVLASTKVDCIVLDLGLPDVGGIQLLSEVRKSEVGSHVRIVVHTARDLSPGELREVERCADAVVLKRGAALERLADEVALHLRRSRPTLPLVAVVPGLAGRTILLADDDVRNVFALASVLEHLGLKVFTADNGRQVLQLLVTTPTISLVLLDLMMPVLDGYKALAEIRADARWAALPVVVLTAKAMPGEREQAMAAGATDFLTKPVDTDRLLAILREHLC